MAAVKQLKEVVTNIRASLAERILADQEMAARMGPYVVAFVEVTPGLAAELLGHVDGNRAVSPARVERYAGAMARGAWMINGEALIFDSENRMINGEHRCRACIKADKPFDTMMVFGVDPAAFSTEDQGKTRSAGDVLSIAGKNNASLRAGALKVVIGMEKGLRDIGNHSVAVDQILDAQARHPDIENFFHLAEKAKQLAPISILAGLFYMFSRRHSYIKVIDFADKLATGTGLDVDSPILALRKKLIENKLAKRRMVRSDYAPYLIQTFNAYITGRPLRVIRASEKMPEIV